MEIRKATPADDLAAIADIYVQSWRAAYQGIVPQGFLDKLEGSGWVMLLGSDEYESYVAVEEGRFIGTAAVCPAREKQMAGWGELVSLYVLPQYFGKGVAAPLFRCAEDGLAHRGYESMYLWVLAENLRAQRFYEKNGFERNGDEMSIVIDGKALTEIRYVKRFEA